MERAYRFDQCRFGTAWRKRTRICLSTELAGERDLCLGGHQHQPLRGRSGAHGASWTRVAQVYPRGLCWKIADSLAAACGLSPSRKGSRSKLDNAGCARLLSLRGGEASHPGPRRRSAAPRDLQALAEVRLVDAGTAKIQERVWTSFEAWVDRELSETTRREVFICPGLVALLLHSYGLHLFERGAPMYEFRHLVVLSQQKMPLVKPINGASWQLLTKWEALQPTQHRLPLPEVLFKAMFAVGWLWGWHRWSATLLLAFEGITRIGEVLKARRADLLLPHDDLDPSHRAIYLRILQPKTKRRGRGKRQHVKIDHAAEVDFLEGVFSKVHPVCNLFPMSASAFRTRWEKILDALEVPKTSRPTPASVRGGGAIQAYRRGENIQNILWKMRILQQSTLEHYLQETAAESLLSQLPQETKNRIRCSSQFYPIILSRGAL